MTSHAKQYKLPLTNGEAHAVLRALTARNTHATDQLLRAQNGESQIDVTTWEKERECMQHLMERMFELIRRIPGKNP